MPIYFGLEPLVYRLPISALELDFGGSSARFGDLALKQNCVITRIVIAFFQPIFYLKIV